MNTPARLSILALLASVSLCPAASASPDPGACAALAETNTDLIILSVVVGQLDSIVALAERTPDARVADPTQLTRYTEQSKDLDYKTADDVEDALESISDPQQARAAQDAIPALRAFGDYAAQRLEDGTFERSASEISSNVKQELIPLHRRAKQATEHLRAIIWDVCGSR